jgi:hypothetical protein
LGSSIEKCIHNAWKSTFLGVCYTNNGWFGVRYGFWRTKKRCASSDITFLRPSKIHIWLQTIHYLYNYA